MDPKKLQSKEHEKTQESKTQESKTQESKTQESKTQESKTHKYFLPHARLNNGQRRYCHCIMKARISKPENHYGFCLTIAKKDWAKAKSMRNKTRARQHYFKLSKTNCVMNYDYNDYSLREVQAFATEKGIPIYEKTQNGIKYYQKDRLVQLLVTNYINKHRKLKNKQSTDKDIHYINNKSKKAQKAKKQKSKKAKKLKS